MITVPDYCENTPWPHSATSYETRKQIKPKWKQIWYYKVEVEAAVGSGCDFNPIFVGVIQVYVRENSSHLILAFGQLGSKKVEARLH